MTDRVALPEGLLGLPSRGPGWEPWLEALPRLVADLLADWSLAPDGAAVHGECSVVVPVVTDGRRAALKVGWPHEEARHEHLALQHWHGEGAVELLRADPHRWALLLERAGPTDLSGGWDVHACEEVGALYGLLHRPAPPQLRRLSAVAADWADRLGRLPRDAPLPHRLVGQAASLARSFAADDATDGTLVHTDLHYANVLAADRRPWLAIDPKPLSGDPHVEPAPLLWNRWDDVAGSDVRWVLRRRLEAVVDAAGLDHDRARDWVVVRLVANGMWTVEEALTAGRDLTRAEREWITRVVTVVKAVQE